MRERETVEEREAQDWLRCVRAGDFPAAWAISERSLPRRLALPQATLPRHMQTVWNGTPLHGRRVLIRCYHGLGDTIQFIRYAPLVKALARDVTVWAQPQLLPLLRGAAGIDRLLPVHDGVPGVDYDVDVELMELPFVFRTTVPTIPARVPYLTVDGGGGEAGGAPRVGIAWRGGGWDERRAVPFALLDPLLDIPGVRWYGLQ